MKRRKDMAWKVLSVELARTTEEGLADMQPEHIEDWPQRATTIGEIASKKKQRQQLECNIIS